MDSSRKTAKSKTKVSSKARKPKNKAKSKSKPKVKSVKSKSKKPKNNKNKINGSKKITQNNSAIKSQDLKVSKSNNKNKTKGKKNVKSKNNSNLKSKSKLKAKSQSNKSKSKTNLKSKKNVRKKKSEIIKNNNTQKNGKIKANKNRGKKIGSKNDKSKESKTNDDENSGKMVNTLKSSETEESKELEVIEETTNESKTTDLLIDTKCSNVTQKFNPKDVESPLHINKATISTSDFDIDTNLLIGKGAYGKVQLVKYKPSNEWVAMKVLPKKKIVKLKQTERVKWEKNLLLELSNHNFIVSMKIAFQNKDNLYIVMEYISGGEFYNFLKRVKKLSNSQCVFYTSQILIALIFLHNKKIVYRDLKSQNILICSDGYIKLTDFGYAKKLNKPLYITNSRVGTPEYMSPEIISKNSKHTFNSDFWSFGVLIYEMLTGKTPFYNENIAIIYDNILNVKKIYFPNYIKSNAKELINNLLIKDNKKRVKNGNLIKKFSFFNKIDFNKIENKSVKPPYIPKIDKNDESIKINRKHFRKISNASIVSNYSEINDDPFINEFGLEDF